jgi:uncharacterized protein YdhG (YjbR/CyaY superfamily)
MPAAEPTTVDAYLAALPAERRTALEAVRATILEHLPEGFEEGIQHGMIDYHIPIAAFPDTYNGKPLSIISLANQKRHMALYLMGVYGDEAEEARFRERWLGTGAPLDMGKSCVRFRRLADVPLEVVAEAVRRISPDDLVALHQRAHRR